jgi:predicted alpha-1,2-mannosidase
MRRMAVLSVAAAGLVGALGACAADDDGPAAPPGSDDPEYVMCDPGPAGGDAPASAAVAPTPTPAPTPASAPLTRWVDPFIGTGGVGFGVGSTFPGPQRPFGMVRPGPDTSSGGEDADFAHCSGYAHDDGFITGFSHTRMNGTGLPDYGVLALMPTIGMTAAKTSQAGYRAPFSHATEAAHPGYYAVTLDDSKVKIELTSTERVALHRYTFPATAGADATVLVDVGHTIPTTKITGGEVKVDGAAREVSGFAHLEGSLSGRFGGVDVFYVARFARPFAASGVWRAGALAPGETSRTGGDTGAWLTFDAAADPVVEARVGISFVDEAHARANLDAEAPASLSFDAARAASDAAWEAMLGKISVEGRSERDERIFYTALYHALLMPTLASDVDGSYRGLDHAVHHADGFRYFTDFSLWDTYRTLHPFLSLVYPDVEREMLDSLVAMGEESGAIPRWPLGDGETSCMVGDSAAIVLGEGMKKGVGPVDYASAYEILRRAATGPLPEHGREGIAEYVAKGYVPIEASGGSAAMTVEYSADDLALAGLAEGLGRADDAAMFRERSHSWKNLFDPSGGFVVGRHADGTFAPFVPVAQHDFYAEGNAWQYTFGAPYDGETLAALFGGRDPMLAKLEQLFTRSACQPAIAALPQPYYWQGNEVDLGAAWLFSAMDDWARTARWTRWILAARYGDGPDGLPGNDDGGTMSAWYLFAASGFYPIAGTDTYLLGSPIFTKVTMHLPGGDLVVSAPETSPVARYVRAATWNGAPITRPRLSHADLAGGGALSLEMSDTP